MLLLYQHFQVYKLDESSLNEFVKTNVTCPDVRFQQYGSTFPISDTAHLQITI